MKKILISLLALFLVHTLLWAQAKSMTINGTVSSFEKSLPLEGVSIVVKGTPNSTGTQSDGTFTLTVSTGRKLLQLSRSGYEKLEMPLTKATQYDIVLRRNSCIAHRKINQRLFYTSAVAWSNR